MCRAIRVDGPVLGVLNLARCQMEKDPKNSWFPTFETACKVTLLLMRLLSVPAEMVMRVRVGERYLGVTGVLALVLMGLYAGFCPPDQAAPLGFLMIVYFIRIVVHRIFCIHRRLRGGPPRHSRYAGQPLLGLVVGRIPESIIKWIEPFLLLAAGLLAFLINKPLGNYLMWSGLGLLGILVVHANLAYNKLLDMIDANLEQQAMAEQFRQSQQKQ
jgi:hypothetical protein